MTKSGEVEPRSLKVGQKPSSLTEVYAYERILTVCQLFWIRNNINVTETSIQVSFSSSRSGEACSRTPISGYFVTFDRSYTLGSIVGLVIDDPQLSLAGISEAS